MKNARLKKYCYVNIKFKQINDIWKISRFSTHYRKWLHDTVCL